MGFDISMSLLMQKILNGCSQHCEIIDVEPAQNILMKWRLFTNMISHNIGH